MVTIGSGGGARAGAEAVCGELPRSAAQPPHGYSPPVLASRVGDVQQCPHAAPAHPTTLPHHTPTTHPSPHILPKNEAAVAKNTRYRAPPHHTADLSSLTPSQQGRRPPQHNPPHPPVPATRSAMSSAKSSSSARPASPSRRCALSRLRSSLLSGTRTCAQHAQRGTRQLKKCCYRTLPGLPNEKATRPGWPTASHHTGPKTLQLLSCWMQTPLIT